MKKTPILLHKDELKQTGIEIKSMQQLNSAAHSAHRDDHYMFIVQQQGHFLWELDFIEVPLDGAALCFVAPGQVHRYIALNNCEGWLLFVDNELISNQCRELFNTYLNTQQAVAVPADDTTFRLLPVMEEIVLGPAIPLQKTLIASLVTTLTNIIASRIIASQHATPLIGGQKYNTIVRFKQLIQASYKTVKLVKAYAALLNITPLYLNEVTKEITGFPASHWINQEILLEAKRLLYYTTLDVKQIAYELGYEDHTYFSRFFKKNIGMTASAFRSRKP